MPATTLPACLKASGLALHFLRKGLPRRSWACPAALRGVLKGEGASATTAPKCTKERGRGFLADLRKKAGSALPPPRAPQLSPPPNPQTCRSAAVSRPWTCYARRDFARKMGSSGPNGPHRKPPLRGGMLRMSWRYAPWSTRLVRFQKPGASRSKQAAQHDKQQLPKLDTTHNSTQLVCYPANTLCSSSPVGEGGTSRYLFSLSLSLIR